MSELPAHRAGNARIKVKVFAVILDETRTSHLVWRGHDEGRPFHRLLGGHLEFGEASVDCAVREIGEELGARLLEPRLMGVLENVFVHEGEPGHEVIFVYAGDLDDPGNVPPEGRWFLDNEERYRVEWRPVDVAPDHPHAAWPLYPTGLQEMLPSAAILEP